jgi:alpha-L-arabinofuranosidase
MKKLSFFVSLMFILVSCTQQAEKNTMVLDFSKAELTINKNVYGHFAEHLGRSVYDGIWVGVDSDIPNTDGYRQDVLEALMELKVPVLRWPGGCFADTYNWKDGVGAAHNRPTLQNAFWGNVIEDNSFGTHEFLNLCEILGADAYIAANVGSGSIREMVEWIEYMTSDLNVPMANWRKENGREKPWDVKFLGIGNESWGCGGEMTPEFYVNLYRQYSIFAKQYGGSEMLRVGCGSYSDYYEWTDVVMEKGHKYMEAISLHHYTIPTGDWGYKSSATDFDEKLYIQALENALKMDLYINMHSDIMDKYDPDKKVAIYVDEWGIWTESEPGTNGAFLHQQNSMRDAIIASITFDIFHQHAERVQMANIAQMVNVLQAMILTEGEKMILTPTYHVFRMYAVHQDATFIPVSVNTEMYEFDGNVVPAISATASKKDGKVNINLTNLNPNKTIDFKVDISDGDLSKIIMAEIITAPKFNSINTYDDNNVVVPGEFSGYSLSNNEIIVSVPPHSIIALQLQ